MKDLFKDPDLWRQKRNELPVDSEPQSGWQEMQSILDKHLPLLPLAPAPHVSKVAKVIKAIKAMKATSVLVTSLTIATVTGTAIYVVKTRQHEHVVHHQPHKNKQTIERDSANRSFTEPDTGADNLQQASKELIASVNKTDSTNKAPGFSAIDNSNTKTTGIASNKSKSLVNRQGGNNNSALAPSTVHIGHNTRNYINQQSGNRQIPSANPTMQQGLISGRNAAPSSNLPEDETQNTSRASNAGLYLSVNAANIAQLSATNNNSLMQPQIFADQPLSNFIIADQYYHAERGSANQIKNPVSKNKAAKNPSTKNAKVKKFKTAAARPLSAIFANVDWGILLGANSSGSFTPGAQNHNIYGSFPLDIYPGVFGTYHLNEKWAINAQVRLLTPLNLSGSYDNKNFSNVDSAQFVKVTDSRKAYFVNIPIHLMYKINNNISVKGGPVINLPVKQINANTSLQRLDINLDTVYFANTQNKIKTTRYDQRINFGLSGGLSVQFNRLIFEAWYQKSLSGYRVISDFGSYKSNPGSLQISVGFKLNNSKHH